MIKLKVSIGQLYSLFSDRKIFPRRRVDPLVKAIGVKVYTLGLSLAQVKEFLEGLGYKVRREAIRQWYLEAGELLLNIEIKKRGFIAADETVIFNLTKKAYLWVAREVKSGEVIALQVTRGRGIGECLRFLEKLKESCKNNPTVYTDRGPWYNWPMKFLKIRHRRKTFGIRNSIEQWFSELKRRIRQFNVCFPTYKPRVSERWIASWVALS